MGPRPSTGRRLQRLPLAQPSWANERVVNEQKGLFIDNRLKLLDSLALLTGARFSNWRTKTTDLDTAMVTDDRKENDVFTPYVALVQNLSPKLAAYASYTSIFYPQDNQDQNGRYLDPERGKTIELGLKGAWLGGRLTAMAAVFKNRKDNLAVPDGGVAPNGNDSCVAVDQTKGRG